MRYPDVGRIGSYANELKSALRRRKSSRAPRARVRVGNSEPRLLAADDHHSARLLALADRLARRGDRDGGTRGDA
jgi:hypothetical protein